MEKLFTIEELCSQLGIGKNTAYALAKNIKHIKIGRRILIPESEVKKYVDEHLR